MKRLVLAALSSLVFLFADARRLNMDVYEPDPSKANGTSVIVCPGGSYYWISRKKEGSEVALRLAEEGYTAYVLKYPHAGTRYFLFKELSFAKRHYPDALDSVVSAYAIIREYAAAKGDDPSRIGLMGFSAGGHLVLEAAEEMPSDSKPAFVAAIYPVITMSDEEIVHKRSRTALLGSRSDDLDLRRKLSVELNVPRDMPVVFLANCVDDKTVDYRNSVLMDKALTEAGVRHEYHQFKTGGHGFGASSEEADWFPLFLSFVRNCVY